MDAPAHTNDMIITLPVTLSQQEPNTAFRLASLPQQPHTGTAINTYTSFLKSVYLRQKFPMNGKWPRNLAKRFINLALIKKQRMSKEETDYFTKQTIQGNMDNIIHKKESISIGEIGKAKGSILPKCILVEGAPGVGKSMFAWKLCRKWSKGKLLQQYRLVVLLRLRDKRVREAKTVSDLFYYYNRPIQQAVVEEIQATGGRGVLLIFEGYDELPAELRTKRSIFLDIINGQELLEATVLITSRPSASGPLYQYMDPLNQHVEILGFTHENIQSYLESTIGDNDTLLQELQQYLMDNHHIRTMLYIPLNCAIVVEVYRVNNSSNHSPIPVKLNSKTWTDLYSSLLRTLLLRYISDLPAYQGQEYILCRFAELPPDILQQLRELGRIAYEGILQDQQVIFSDLPSDFSSLGLMQCVPELYVDEGATKSYNFLHLTLQEYMAAFHLSEQPVEKQIEIFKKYHSMQYDSSCHLQIVLRFLAGLKFAHYPNDNIRSILTSQITSHSNSELRLSSLDALHWIFESQNVSKLCETIGISTVCAHLDYRPLTVFDCFVLGYCVSHSNCPWEIILKDCGIGNDGIEMLVREVLKGNGYISKINLGENQITSTGLSKLSQLSKLESVNLTTNFLGDGGAIPLFTKSPVVDALQYLNLHKTRIGMADCQALHKFLSSSRLKCLDISNNGLTPEAIELIMSGLTEHNTTLEELYLEYNDFGNGGAVSLLKSPLAHHLKSLWLSHTGIGEEDFQALHELLSSTSHLQGLDISDNELNSDAVKLLLSGLQKNTTLLKLHMLGIRLGSEGIVLLHESSLASRLNVLSLTLYGAEDCRALGDLLSSHSLNKLDIRADDSLPIDHKAVEQIITGLQANTTLKRLVMWDLDLSCQNCNFLRSIPLQDLLLINCKIKANGASELAKSLPENTTLQTLSLWRNPIHVNGAIAFSETLPQNESLKELDLNDESITPEGTQRLIESLSRNTRLLKLVLPKQHESSVSVEAYMRVKDRIRWKQVQVQVHV